MKTRTSEVRDNSGHITHIDKTTTYDNGETVRIRQDYCSGGFLGIGSGPTTISDVEKIDSNGNVWECYKDSSATAHTRRGNDGR